MAETEMFNVVLEGTLAYMGEQENGRAGITIIPTSDAPLANADMPADVKEYIQSKFYQSKKHGDLRLSLDLSRKPKFYDVETGRKIDFGENDFIENDTPVKINIFSTDEKKNYRGKYYFTVRVTAVQVANDAIRSRSEKNPFA